MKDAVGSIVEQVTEVGDLLRTVLASVTATPGQTLRTGSLATSTRARWMSSSVTSWSGWRPFAMQPKQHKPQ